MTTHSGVNFLMGFMVNQIILQHWAVNGVNGFFKKRQITNEFWLEVFNSWKQLCRVQEPKSNMEINSSCLWYNYKFSDNPLYFDKWSRQGIRQIGDILDASGAVLTLEMLGSKYNLNINFLEYHRIKILAKNLFQNRRKITPFHSPT